MPTATSNLLTRNELTDLLNAEAVARAEQRTLANIARRAQTLFEDGYSALPLGGGTYCVFSPKGDTYAVSVTDAPAGEIFGSCCSCPCFQSRKTCKHLQAVQAAILEGTEGDARQDNDDDRYPEF